MRSEEIAELVAELETKREQVEDLAKELEATNHGVIALHAELEDAREAEAHLAAIVRSSDDAMVSLSLEETITSWNPGAERLLGYAAEEIIGSPVKILIPDSEQGDFDVALKRLKTGERSSRYETWRRRKNGTLVEVSVTLSAMRDSSNQLVGYSAVVSDITERRRSEEELSVARAEKEVFAERDRIARDLHDLVIQRLFASGMALQGVLNLAPRNEMRARIENVIDDLDQTIREIRSSIFALHHSPQLASGLRARVLELANGSSASLGFEPRVYFEGPVDAMVPDRVGEHLMAVLREALSNVARHAHASNVEINVNAGEQLALIIADDGRGIGDVSRRSGLVNIAERARILGGTFSTTGADEGGTCLEWRVPLDP